MKTIGLMQCDDLGLPGCFEIRPRLLADSRGYFLKTYHEEWFQQLGLRTDWREEYFSASRRGVIRGLHFQTPPCHHAKLVTCIAGEVLDVLLDLREGPSYGQVISRRLSAESPSMLYLAPGIAHGFLACSEESVMYYKVTSVHSPTEDQGILWSSIPFTWPTQAPTTSSRDAAFPAFQDFVTPFRS